MPTFRYRALTQIGELVSGSLSAQNAAEVTLRIEYLGLIPIEAVTEQSEAQIRRRRQFSLMSRPRAEDVTIFTGDLALLLRTGARINDALELLASDADIGRMRPTTAALAAAILSGESFGEAISRHPAVFPAIYVALVRVGEAAGTLVTILEALSAERQRAEALRRRLSDTLRYPAFLLLAAGGVLLFFLTFVLPQFANVFRDFNAKLDPVLLFFLGLSDFLRSNTQALAAGLLRFHPRRLAVVAPSGGAGGLHRGDVAAADRAADHELPPHDVVLPQPRPAVVERRDPDRQPAHSRRHDGNGGG